MSAADVLPARPIVTCMECGSLNTTSDWLIEDVPTIGGGLIAVRLCFDCRGLAAWPVPDRRDGSCDRWYCDGEHEGLDVWHAFCGSCEQGWSCWDEHCVREWAGQHDEGCDIYINPPEAREFR